MYSNYTEENKHRYADERNQARRAIRTVHRETLISNIENDTHTNGI